MKKFSPQEALEKIRRYCAYQERSHLEVRKKLYEYGLFREQVDDLITRLITDGFLNEERFARAFAGGKFRMKKWGRLKIEKALEAKGVSRNCIRLGLSEIDETAYRQTLKEILKTKASQTDTVDLFQKKNKVSHYALQKGYEPELIWEILRSEDTLP